MKTGFKYVGEASDVILTEAERNAYLGELKTLRAYLGIAENVFDNIIKELITVDEKGFLTMHNICGGCGLGGNP